MSQINHIRELARDGYKVAEIARKTGVDEKTVRKYKAKSDFSPKVPVTRVVPSGLDPFKAKIAEYLEEDKEAWYKQHHTALRVHTRLQEDFKETYTLSYNTVQRYLKKLRQSQREQRANLELVWHPGQAQVDFGEVECIDRGQRVRNKSLIVSFPYSNNSFAQMFRGETAECVCQGLKDIFAYMGGVPELLVFDNATGVGRRVGEAIHETDLFARFRAHHNFSVRFCNPNSGHEKGNVENKVGYTRNNLFVPVPVFDDIEVFNRQLLDRHLAKAKETHYKKLVPIEVLFEEDRKAFLPLPHTPFDVCRYEQVKADGYGKVRVDNRHYYSTRPENALKEVWVALRAHTVDILDDQKSVLMRHSRKFGEQRSDTCDPRTSLAILLRNAGAWPNSGLREIVPESLRKAMDNQPRAELQQTIRTMQQLTRTYSFETALLALEEGLRINRTNFCDAAALAARLSGFGLSRAPEPGPDLKSYDTFLQGGDLTC